MNFIEQRVLSKIENKYGVELSSVIERKAAYRYLDKYLEAKADIVFSKKRAEKNVIWMYWDSEKRIPKIVRRCMESVKRNTDRKVIVLSEKTISEYLDLPEYIWQKYKEGIISKTHFSDVLRVTLLSVYGGTWIDATVFCTDTIPEEYLCADFFVFQRGPWKMYEFEQLIRCSSWFMTAREGHPLIVRLRDSIYAYWRQESKLLNYYLFHILLGRLLDYKKEYFEEWKKMPFAVTHHPHYLNAIIGYRYEEQEWEKAKRISPIHKLSYKRKIADSKSYYKMIMNNEIS